ncbi:hypothetical protein MUK42_30034 [Musa troglodytarum]|uniref:Uncharacterized protein n=1 Tax=Musa troglodytarum TaxID=320322 RepID=A0A9E7KCZ7_9LILI|nr:hypothetical protein MUK42_30034 [Musa troglodytarum]
MATPSPAPPVSAAAATTSGASDPSSATHPLTRPFASPPLLPASPFSSQPISKPLGHPPPPPPPQGFLYHQRGFATRPAAGPAPAASDQSVAVANPAVYTRNATPAALMTFAAATQSRPFTCAPVDQPVRNVPIRNVRPRLPPSTSQPVTPIEVPRPVVTVAGASRSAPVATQLKAATLSSVSSTPENNNCKERDKSRDDDVVVIHGRKVRVLDGCSPSLYSLCRSWMQNDQPHEIQVSLYPSFYQ